MNSVILRRKDRSKGVAAVEAAILLPIFVVFLTFPVFYATCFWHYTAAQKAAQDAARYMSSVRRYEMRSPNLAPQAVAVARTIITRELRELKVGNKAVVQVLCGVENCVGTEDKPLPSSVHVIIKMNVFDTYFGVVDVGRYGVTVNADVTMPYVGV